MNKILCNGIDNRQCTKNHVVDKISDLVILTQILGGHDFVNEINELKNNKLCILFFSILFFSECSVMYECV